MQTSLNEFIMSLGYIGVTFAFKRIKITSEILHTKWSNCLVNLLINFPLGHLINESLSNVL